MADSVGECGTLPMRTNSSGSARQSPLKGKHAVRCTFKFYVRLENVIPRGWQRMLIRVYFKDSGGKTLHIIDASCDGTRDWTEVTKTADIPQNASEAMVEFNLFKRPGTVWIDNVRLFLHNLDGTLIKGPTQPGKTTPITMGKDWVWWEGEDAVATNVVPSTYWLDIKSEKLSGGKWWNSQQEHSDKEPLFAEYDIEVPSDGTYHLWGRDVYQRNTFHYLFDNGEWQTVSHIVRKDIVGLAKYRTANWGYWGKVYLKKGRHKFRIGPEPGSVKTVKVGNKRSGSRDIMLPSIASF